jgi:alkyl hydroperoxide reductase subunit AhpC
MADNQGTVRIGDTVPDFTLPSTEGEIKFHEWKKDSWAILFSHPKDFTPVCTTELGTVQKYLPKFTERGVKPIGLSVDTVESHQGWVKDINETQDVTVAYPIVADADRKVAAQFGMLDQTNMDAPGMPLTVRAVYIIDTANKVRLILVYPASCGRNFDEIIRCIDSLQLTDNNKVTTPANWNKGDDLIVAPPVSTDDAKEMFGEVRVIKPYLRMIKSSQLKK